MPARNDDLFFADDEDGDESWLPSDFFDDDVSDEDMQDIHNIQDLVGKPIEDIIEPYNDIVKSGRAGTVRAVRFGSGSEALLWLFRRGIFLFSSLVRFGDGSWGVAIGDSERPLNEEIPKNDIPF